MVKLRVISLRRNVEKGSVVIDGDEVRESTGRSADWVVERLRRVGYFRGDTLEAKARDAYPYSTGYTLVEVVEDA